MHNTIRSFLALSVVSVSAFAFTSPPPVITVGPPNAAPQVLVLPKSLEGVVTLDQLKAYAVYQAQLRDDPSIKAVNLKIAAKIKELQDLQSQFAVLRDKALASNPEMKAIGEKIQKALAPRPSAGALPK